MSATEEIQEVKSGGAVHDVGGPSHEDHAHESTGKEASAKLKPASKPSVGKGSTAGSEKRDDVTGEVQDLGPASVSPTQDSSPGKAASKAAGKTVTPKAQKEETENEGEELSEPETQEDEGEEISESRTTKMGMIKSIYEKLDSMKKAEIEATYDAILAATNLNETREDTVVSEDTSISDKLEEVLPQETEIDVKQDVEALVGGEELSEEFKEKAATIFEAAVFSKVTEEVNSRIKKMDETYIKELDESISKYKEEITDKVDDYLNYVIKEWLEENELAVEKGIKAELVEDFMSGLRNLFTEHYINIPDEKVDMVDDLFTKVEDLEAQLNEQVEKGVTLTKELDDHKRNQSIQKVCEDLTESETEKMKSLAEGTNYENDEQYEKKLSIVKENYFPKSGLKVNLSEDLFSNDTEGEVKDTDAPRNTDMEQYTSAISRTLKR